MDDKYLTLVNKYNPVPGDWLLRAEFTNGSSSLGKPYRIEKETLFWFERLRDRLLEEGVQIEIDSAYRDSMHQRRLFSFYEAELGAEGAARAVARPGHSEHELGLAIDLSIVVNGRELKPPDEDRRKVIFMLVHRYLARYGFILRYPEGKESVTGYLYEPWHIRYVGHMAALEIWKKGMTLEEYLDKGKGGGDFE